MDGICIFVGWQIGMKLAPRVMFTCHRECGAGKARGRDDAMRKFATLSYKQFGYRIDLCPYSAAKPVLIKDTM